VTYSIEFSRQARKQIAQLDPAMRRRVSGVLTVLSVDPYPPKSVALTNTKARRVRVGDYRIVYEVHDKILTVVIFQISHRRDVYRNL
jgi:mRNA interferase RelE/StbE